MGTGTWVLCFCRSVGARTQAATNVREKLVFLARLYLRMEGPPLHWGFMLLALRHWVLQANEVEVKVGNKALICLP